MTQGKFSSVQNATREAMKQLENAVLYGHIKRISALADRLMDPIIRLILDYGDFLEIINALGKIELTVEDRKAVRLVIVKVVGDIYAIINPEKSSDVPSTVIKFERGYGTSDVILVDDEVDPTVKRVGWFTLFKNLINKYDEKISTTIFSAQKYFHLLRSQLMETKSLVSQRIKEFLEELLFDYSLLSNDVLAIEGILNVFKRFPKVLDLNFKRFFPPVDDSITPFALVVYRGGENRTTDELVDLFRQNDFCSWFDVDLKYHSTILGFAARQKDGKKVDVVSLLLKSTPFTTAEGLVVDVDTPDLQGNTPLHHAVLGGRWTMIYLLMQRGANPSVVNSDGLTPIQLVDKLDDLNEIEKNQLRFHLTIDPKKKKSNRDEDEESDQEENEKENESNDDEKADEDNGGADQSNWPEFAQEFDRIKDLVDKFTQELLAKSSIKEAKLAVKYFKNNLKAIASKDLRAEIQDRIEKMKERILPSIDLNNHRLRYLYEHVQCIDREYNQIDYFMEDNVKWEVYFPPNEGDKNPTDNAKSKRKREISTEDSIILSVHYLGDIEGTANYYWECGPFKGCVDGFYQFGLDDRKDRDLIEAFKLSHKEVETFLEHVFTTIHC